MKPRRRLLVVCVWLVAVCVPATAQPVSQLNPSNYLNDFANVVDANTASQINLICQQIDEKAHAQIAVVTINSLEGRDIEGYAVDLFKQWGVGSKSTNRGVLILYAMQDRKARIEVGYGLEPILPDGKVGGFQREAIPLMRQGNTSGALLLVTQRVADVIAADARVQLTNTPAESAPSDDRLLRWIVVLVLIVLMYPAIRFFLLPVRWLLGWFLPGVVGGGYKRRGRRGDRDDFGGIDRYRGGGFGGFGGFGGGGSFGGGGGGFGGFGGGMSGGGGASSGW